MEAVPVGNYVKLLSRQDGTPPVPVSSEDARPVQEPPDQRDGEEKEAVYVPTIIMVNMDPPHHIVAPSSNFQNPYHLVGMIHWAPNTTRRVSKNSSLVKVLYADDHTQGSLNVVVVFLCVCFCVLRCWFHLERREAATTARTQAAILKIGKRRQSNFTFSNLLRGGKVNFGFQQIYIRDQKFCCKTYGANDDVGGGVVAQEEPVATQGPKEQAGKGCLDVVHGEILDNHT